MGSSFQAGPCLGRGMLFLGQRGFQLSTCTLQCCISPVHRPRGSAQHLTLLLKVWRVHKRKTVIFSFLAL